MMSFWDIFITVMLILCLALALLHIVKTKGKKSCCESCSSCSTSCNRK
ncbi:MAG: FeoB-associated Cys-rich membrane protein [Oscillospiraceae bacterium]|nr:FeoB-associated Cys-rich membrane protein [Oscillospiraceae bacterium]